MKEALDTNEAGQSEESTLRRAHAVHPIAAAQFEYAAFTLDVETRGIVETCKELGIALVAYSPLGRGLLTGTFVRRLSHYIEETENDEEADRRSSIDSITHEVQSSLKQSTLHHARSLPNRPVGPLSAPPTTYSCLRSMRASESE